MEQIKQPVPKEHHIREECGVFGVSRSAAAIRLEQLGYLNRKKDYEYRDPLEVWP
jgi:Mn-dependent DtxR family transcriptional regulator